MTTSADQTLAGSSGRPSRGANLSSSSRVQAWALVVAFFLTINGMGALYWTADVELSAGLQLLLRALAIVVFWRLLEAECAPYRVTFPLDMGYLLYATNFILLPYYLWRTQRWWGLGKLLGVAGIWMGTYALWYGVTWLIALE